jgi:hypothetical protein
MVDVPSAEVAVTEGFETSNRGNKGNIQGKQC